MQIAPVCLVGFALLIAPLLAKADTWIPYTDGRAGGCWLNRVNVLYGCTPQPVQHSNSSDSSEGYQAQNREDYCQQEQQRLENANSDFNRTVTSMRAAEERFRRSGC